MDRSLGTLFFLAAIGSGCATGAPAARTRPVPPPSPKSDPDPPVLVDRTLVYPVRWGRAEDLAETLEPLLLKMYGPGVRIVPQTQSNKLLILIPSRLEREAMQRSQESAGPSRARP